MCSYSHSSLFQTVQYVFDSMHTLCTLFQSKHADLEPISLAIFPSQFTFDGNFIELEFYCWLLHVNTPVVPCANFVTITVLELEWEQNWCSIIFELWWKHRQCNRYLYWFTSYGIVVNILVAGHEGCNCWWGTGTCGIYLWTVSNTRRCQPWF